MAKKKEKALEIPKSLAIALLKAMGFKTAKKMDLDKLTENINAIEELPDEPFDTEELEAISGKLMDAETAIVVDDVEDDEDDADDDDAEPEDDDLEDDDNDDTEETEVEEEEAEDDEEDVEEKPKKKKKKDKKAKKEKTKKTKAKSDTVVKAKKESLDSVTLELIQTKPMTVASLVKTLLKKFPDKDEEALTRTTKRRLTGHLQTKYDVEIEKSKKGAYSVA